MDENLGLPVANLSRSDLSNPFEKYWHPLKNLSIHFIWQNSNLHDTFESKTSSSMAYLINFLYFWFIGWSTSTSISRESTSSLLGKLRWIKTSRHSAATSTSLLVHLTHDWIHDSLHFFLFLFINFLFKDLMIGIHPCNGRVNHLLYSFFICCCKFTTNIFIAQCVPHIEYISFKSILSIHTCFLSIIFCFELLSISDHTFHFFL